MEKIVSLREWAEDREFDPELPQAATHLLALEENGDYLNSQTQSTSSPGLAPEEHVGLYTLKLIKG